MTIAVLKCVVVMNNVRGGKSQVSVPSCWPKPRTGIEVPKFLFLKIESGTR
jgi:hypothetical protein